MENSTMTQNINESCIKKKIRNNFVISLSLGAAYCCSVSFFNINGLNKIIVPAVIMIVYFGWGIKKIKSIQFKFIFGESLYYLGFIYTLIAIVSSMLASLNSDLQNLTLRSMTEFFGMALITTIIGMVLKIIVTQFEDYDPDTFENLDNYRYNLQEISSKIYHTFDEIHDKSNQISQDLDNVFKVVIGSIEKSVDSAEKAITTNTEKAVKTIENATVLTESKIKGELEVFSNELNFFFDNSNSNLKAVINDWNSLFTSSDNLLTSLNQNFSTLNEQTKQSVQLSTDIIKSSTNEYETTLKESTKIIKGVFEKFEDDIRNLKIIDYEKINSLNTCIDNTKNDIKKIGKLFDAFTDKFQNQMVNTEKKFSNLSSEFSEEIKSTIVEIVNSIKGLKSIDDQIKKTYSNNERIIESLTHNFNSQIEKIVNSTIDQKNHLINLDKLNEKLTEKMRDNDKHYSKLVIEIDEIDKSYKRLIQFFDDLTALGPKSVNLSKHIRYLDKSIISLTDNIIRFKGMQLSSNGRLSKNTNKKRADRKWFFFKAKNIKQ